MKKRCHNEAIDVEDFLHPFIDLEEEDETDEGTPREVVDLEGEDAACENGAEDAYGQRSSRTSKSKHRRSNDNEFRDGSTSEEEDDKKAQPAHTSEFRIEGSCPICLSEYESPALTDKCFHAFCFACILQWAEVNARCPLCKAPFVSIIHAITSVSSYQRHWLPKHLLARQPSPAAPIDAPRVRPSTNTTRVRRRRPVEWGEAHGRPSNGDGLSFRRRIYELGTPVRLFSSARPTPIGAADVQRDKKLRERVEGWVRRELRALLHDDDLDIPAHCVLAAVLQHGPTAEKTVNELRWFVFEHAELFAHELDAFARTHYDMETYDRLAASHYHHPTPNTNTTTLNRSRHRPPPPSPPVDAPRAAADAHGRGRSRSPGRSPVEGRRR
mmetsp:Transcript_9233/g.15840  ORF Transcript_9233/g.15840 Transcript_9233/m.15840 type:complete len:384 (-) Transcript_9233:514-1665(-)